MTIYNTCNIFVSVYSRILDLLNTLISFENEIYILKLISAVISADASVISILKRKQMAGRLRKCYEMWLQIIHNLRNGTKIEHKTVVNSQTPKMISSNTIHHQDSLYILLIRIISIN